MLPDPARILRSSQLVEKNARAARASGKEQSYSDETITPEIAITSSAVIAIITIMSQDIASLPLLLYARRGRAKYRAYDSPYYRLMHDRPNSEHSSMVFRELMMGHLLAWGNFYAQKILDDSGAVVELWPLRPDRMVVQRIDGERVYIYSGTNGKPRIFLSDEVLHIPAFGFDGLIGYSRIALARNAIGLAISSEKFGSKFYANGTNVGIFFKHPGALSDPAYDRLQTSIKERSGVAESSKPMILEENMSIERIGIPPDDRQFLETRKFQLAEINRILGPVPPHMIGDVTNTTSWGTGIDSQEQGYVNHTLRPYTVRIEQGLDNQLLLESDRASGQFFEHLFDGLLRGDIQTRYESFVKAINNGIMSPNEVRARENMNPYAGGDVYWKPLNMASSDGTNTGNAPTTTQDTSANAGNSLSFMPLLKDAAQRIIRREENEIDNARKRYVEKGKAEKFTAWAEEFYKQDYPEFLLQVLSPFSTSSIMSDAKMKTFIREYCAQRGTSALGMLGDVEYSSATVDQIVELLAIQVPSNDGITTLEEKDSPAETVKIITQPLTVNITNHQPAPVMPEQPAPVFNIQNDISVPEQPVAAPPPPPIINIQNDIHVPETPVSIQNDIHVPEPAPAAEQPAPIVNIQNDVYVPDPPARKLKLTKKGDQWLGEAE